MGLIKAFEGKDGKFEATRAQDPGGLWEIGWSHKLAGMFDPLWNCNFSPADANDLALKDLDAVAAGVCKIIPAVVGSLTEGQYAAILDFAYNEGVGRFAGSTLCHFVKTGNLTLVPGQFGLWVYGHVNGVATELPGLVRRRAAEKAVWLTDVPA